MFKQSQNEVKNSPFSLNKVFELHKRILKNTLFGSAPGEYFSILLVQLPF